MPLTPPRSPAESAIAQAEARYQAGAYADAAAILGPLAGQMPRHPAAIRLLGLCRLKLDDPSGGLTLLERARGLTPDDPFARLHHGLGLHAAGRHVEAAAVFRDCQALLPDDPAPSLNLAAVLLALGHHRDALAAARKARLRAPHLPQAHYILGCARLAAEQPEGAEQAFRAALDLAPEFADAWLNLGLARYRLGDIQGAIEAMRRALAAAPGHRAATANLGAFLRLTGDAPAAEALLREANDRDPGNAEARVNLAAGLLQQERAAEALDLLDAAEPPPEPRLSGHWRAQRALALLQLGRPAEARRAIDAIESAGPGLAPLLLWRRVLLAKQEGDGPEARGFAGEMEAALRDAGSLTPEHAIMARFDLAKFWSGEGERQRAFLHWTEGHRLLARFQPFSRQAWREFVDASIARFDHARLDRGPLAGNRDPAPVFIVGMPRSGTTLAEQILGAHRDVFAAGERRALFAACEALGRGGTTPDCVERLASPGAAALDQAAAAYLKELHVLAPGKSRIVDKMPGNFAWLGAVRVMLPGARIIHCTRDPRDIGLSIFTFRFHGHHPYAHDLGDLGWYIGEHQRLMDHWRAVLPNLILTVALKDWVDDFAGTLRRVLDFLGLPYDPDCERFYERESRVSTVSHAQVRQPVNARGLGRWRDWEAELRPLISALTDAGLPRP